MSGCMKAWVLGAALLAAGCATNDSPRPQLLTVSPAPAGALPSVAPAAMVASMPPVLVLRRVELPEYLLARRVRYRDGSSTLAEWPDTVWAERLEIGVTRELAAALRQRLPGWTVCDAACIDGAAGDAVLHVEFSALDLRRAASRLQGRVGAQLHRRGSTALGWSWSRAIDLPARADTPQAHADAIGAAIGLVADALSQQLRAGH